MKNAAFASAALAMMAAAAAFGADGATRPFYFDALNVTAMHEAGIRGAGVKVMVIDSGMYDISLLGEPQLSYKFVGGTKRRGSMHGGGVASLIASKKYGVAPDCELYGWEDGTTQALLDGIDWAISNKIDILNMSLSYNPINSTEEERARISAKTREAVDAGVIVVLGAGNSFMGELTQCPQDVVGAIRFGGLKPDGKTPAKLTNSWCKDFVTFGEDVPMFTNAAGHEGKEGGTSFAAPLGAGVIALYLCQHPGLTRDEIYGILEDTAVKLAPARTKEFGWGLVQAGKMPARYRTQAEWDKARAAAIPLERAKILNPECVWCEEDKSYHLELKAGTELKLDLRPEPANATDPNVYWYIGNLMDYLPVGTDNIIRAPKKVPQWKLFEYAGQNADFKPVVTLRLTVVE